MAKLRSAMDSSFWDQSISTPQNLEGCARSIPGDPFPLDGARASRVRRFHQLNLLGRGFPLGLIPSLFSSSPPQKDPTFYLQTNLLALYGDFNRWIGLTWQFRPEKLVTSVKSELSKPRRSRELNFDLLRDVGKHFLDKSLYSLGLSTQIFLDSTSLLLSAELNGEKKGRDYKMVLQHQLPQHDITLEARWPELFIDHKGGYWEVPESISLDMSSLASGSGFRYRFGIHKGSGHPKAVNALNDQVPSALMPGLCGKAACSYEKHKYFYRRKIRKSDYFELARNLDILWRPPYDLRLGEPHVSISGIIGGAIGAWFRGRDYSPSDENISRSVRRRPSLNADLFASACLSLQHGMFKKAFGDMTRVDARVDVPSASALANFFRNSSADSGDSGVSCPKLNLILQQQILGPIVFRVDTRLPLDSSLLKHGHPQVEDLIYSLTYSLRILDSGKVVAWYSKKRKEGMVELRLYDF